MTMREVGRPRELGGAACSLLSGSIIHFSSFHRAHAQKPPSPKPNRASARMAAFCFRRMKVPPGAGIRTPSACLRFQRLHVVVGEAEVVADLVDKDVADDGAKR